MEVRNSDQAEHKNGLEWRATDDGGDSSQQTKEQSEGHGTHLKFFLRCCAAFGPQLRRINSMR
jgi:hypothetical protein